MLAGVRVGGSCCKEIIEVVDDMCDVVGVLVDPLQGICQMVEQECKSNGRHLSTYHLPCQWMPSWFQSSLRTAMRRNAFLR